MNRSILSYIAAAATMLLLALSCNTEKIEKDDKEKQEEIVDKAPEVLKLTMEQFKEEDERGKALEAKTKSVWNTDDMVSLFYKDAENEQWKFKGKDRESSGSLVRVSDNKDLDEKAASDITLVYPYKTSSKTGENGLIEFTLSSSQNHRSNTYGSGSNVMFAKRQGNSFELKNLMGYIVIQLQGDKTVSQIKLTGKNKEKLSNLVFIDPAAGALKTKPGEDGADEGEEVGGFLSFNKLTLKCGDSGAKLSSDAASAFFFAIPPQTFSKGFDIEIKFADNTKVTKQFPSSISVKRNIITRMDTIIL